MGMLATEGDYTQLGQQRNGRQVGGAPSTVTPGESVTAEVGWQAGQGRPVPVFICVPVTEGQQG